MVVIIVENCCSVDVICSTILFFIIQITLIDKPFLISVVVGTSVDMRALDVRICVVVGVSVVMGPLDVGICVVVRISIVMGVLDDKICAVVGISVVMGTLDVRICVVTGISVDVASSIIKDNNHSVYYKSRSTNISFYKSFYVIITNSSSFYRFICYLNLSFLYLSKLF
jgi:hypothetical protein